MANILPQGESPTGYLYPMYHHYREKQLLCDLIHKLILNDLLARNVFSFFSPFTLIQLMRTCSIMYDEVAEYMKSMFNVNRILSRFFSEPNAFRSVQYITGTLISGSAALQFFDRSYYAGSDLDIYVHLGWTKAMGGWILGHGYRFAPGKGQVADFHEAASDPKFLNNKGCYIMRGVAGVFNFLKESPTGEELKVQMIVATRSPMEIILNFHSTCVMNVISYEKAYCLFPRATLEERRSLVIATDGPGQLPALLKYEERGWDMVLSVSPWEGRGRNPSFPFGKRFLDDRYTLTIALDLTGLSLSRRITQLSPALTQDPVCATSWTFRYLPDEGGEMEFSSISDERLLYTYALDDEDIMQTAESRLRRAESIATWSTPDSALFPNTQRRYLDGPFVEYVCWREKATQEISAKVACTVESAIPQIVADVLRTIGLS